MIGQSLTAGNNLDTVPHTEVTIDAFGRVQIEGKNFTGNACSMIGEALRRVVGGGKTDTSDPKPEMYQGGMQSQTDNIW